MQLLCYVICACLSMGAARAASNLAIDYYWRDYFGSIPFDALPGGKDEKGQDVYVGQAYIHEYGIAVVLIHPGILEVEVPMYGYRTTNYLIKILCTRHPSNFIWLRTSARTLHLDTTNYEVPLGGYDHKNNNGRLVIGRIKFENTLRIGSVAAYALGFSKLYFPHKDKERDVETYEVLVYSNFFIVTEFDVNATSLAGQSSSNATSVKVRK